MGTKSLFLVRQDKSFVLILSPLDSGSELKVMEREKFWNLLLLQDSLYRVKENNVRNLFCFVFDIYLTGGPRHPLCSVHH